jgi:hypothetical protein
VRINLDPPKWDEAVADAGQVDAGFEFKLPYDPKQEWRYVNVYVFSEQVEGGIVGVWNSPYLQYVLDTGDPRTPWVDGQHTIHTTFPMDVTEIPYYPQRKYQDWGDDIDLVTWTEMLLIEAEAFLTSGSAQDITDAMAIINSLRTRPGVGIAPWPAPADLDEAWTFFRRERGVELWLEGRRLADVARWKRNNAPGSFALEELGTTNGGPDLSNMPLCAPTPIEERDLNPNL